MVLSISATHWYSFLLVLVRVAAMVMVAPVLGARPVPAQAKIGLSVLLAIVIAPLQGSAVTPPANWLAGFTDVAGEVVVGLLLGFAATVVFSAVRMAAHLIGVQIGFGFANTLDPLSTDAASFLDSFYNLLAVVVFLNLGGHHALIAGLANSFELVPLRGYQPEPIVADRLVLLATGALSTATRLAMPVLGTMLLTDAAMALVIRTIPQMNIFAVGLPIKMMIGMFAMAAMMPMAGVGFADLTRTTAAAVNGLVR